MAFCLSANLLQHQFNIPNKIKPYHPFSKEALFASQRRLLCIVKKPSLDDKQGLFVTAGRTKQKHAIRSSYEISFSTRYSITFRSDSVMLLLSNNDLSSSKSVVMLYVGVFCLIVSRYFLKCFNAASTRIRNQLA